MSEIWLEKDALAGVVSPITELYDVPLMVARGYASLSFLHTAAEAIDSLDVPAYIYHLGDFDPSGVNAGEKHREIVARDGAERRDLLQARRRHARANPRMGIALPSDQAERTADRLASATSALSLMQSPRPTCATSLNSISRTICLPSNSRF